MAYRLQLATFGIILLTVLGLMLYGMAKVAADMAPMRVGIKSMVAV